MPSPRRYRFIAIAIVVVFTFLIYVREGPSMTTNSEFYKRTVNLMEAKARGSDSHLHRAGDSFAHHGDGDVRHKDDRAHAADSEQQHKGQHGEHDDKKKPAAPINEQLKARLREAEQLAKKSADDKYRILRDIEQEVSRERAERELLDDRKAAARRLQQPAPDARPGESEGEARDREHADEVTLRATYNELTSHSPVTIFSKSYCPHSARAKRILLQAFDIAPRPHVVELDLHPRGPDLQTLLFQKTGRRTVPNVMVDGQSMGGGDDMDALWESGELAARLRDAGRSAIKSIHERLAYGSELPGEVPR